MKIDQERLEEAKRQSVGQVLFKCARLLNDHALAEVRRRTGQTGLRPVHTSLFPHIDLDGTRLTELAQRMGISKQAVGQLVDELETMGVLERVPDPTDGRAKLIRFAGGADGLLHGLAILGEVEAELAEAIGRDRLGELHASLLALVEVLEARVER